jgi:hypothetical protein
VSVDAKSGGWTMSENTNIMNGMIAQRTTLESDATLSPMSLQQGASMQGQQTKTDVAFAGGKAKGSAQTPSQTGPQTKAIDTDLPSGTIASDALQMALPLFRWANNATFTVNVFSAGKGTVEPITLTVVGSESVTVPAGTFVDACRIEVVTTRAGVATTSTTWYANRLGVTLKVRNADGSGTDLVGAAIGGQWVAGTRAATPAPVTPPPPAPSTPPGTGGGKR